MSETLGWVSCTFENETRAPNEFIQRRLIHAQVKVCMELLDSADPGLKPRDWRLFELNSFVCVLMDVAASQVDILQELNLEFERMYSEQVDQSKALYSTYFGQIRDLENAYFDQVTVVVRFQTAP